MKMPQLGKLCREEHANHEVESRVTMHVIYCRASNLARGFPLESFSVFMIMWHLSNPGMHCHLGQTSEL